MSGTKLTDTEKWKRYKSGDNNVLSAIYTDNARILYQYGLKFTSKHSIIEDAIQDLFSKLISDRKNIGDTDNIKFYLLISFKRRLIRLLKRELRYDHSFDSDDYVFGIRYSIEHDIILNENQDSQASLLIKLLKKLSPNQKEGIYLRFTLGFTYAEISEFLNMNIESSRNLIYRAIKSLKQSIEER